MKASNICLIYSSLVPILGVEYYRTTSLTYKYLTYSSYKINVLATNLIMDLRIHRNIHQVQNFGWIMKAWTDFSSFRYWSSSRNNSTHLIYTINSLFCFLCNFSSRYSYCIFWGQHFPFVKYCLKSSNTSLSQLSVYDEWKCIIWTFTSISTHQLKPNVELEAIHDIKQHKSFYRIKTEYKQQITINWNEWYIQKFFWIL